MNSDGGYSSGCWFVVLVCGVLMIVCGVIWKARDAEISDVEYENCRWLAISEPASKPLFEKAMEDGVVSCREYAAIRSDLARVTFKAALKPSAEADVRK